MADPYWDVVDAQAKRARYSYDGAVNSLAGNKLANGDYQGARNMLARYGDLEGAGQIQEQQDAQRKQQAEALERITSGIAKSQEHLRTQGMDDKQAAAAAWAAATRFAPQLGIDPGVLERHKADYDADPAGWTAFWGDKAKSELRIFQNGRQVIGLDPTTGQKRWGYEMPADPNGERVSPGYRLTADGKGWEPIPGGPADPRQAGRLAASKRKPGGGRGRGGGGASSSLPPGYVPR